MKRLLLILLLPALAVLSLFVGSVSIAPVDVLHIVIGGPVQSEAYRFIVMESRLPQMITALLAGGALAVSGLLLQTAFRNPLAGPGIFGVSSGAGLGVALVMLTFGGTMAVGTVSIGGAMAVLVGAFVGAMAVTLLLLAFSTAVRSATMLLIVGIMTGYVASGVVALLNFWASSEGVHAFVMWGMGSFGGVSMRLMPVFASVTLMAIGLSLLLVKPLNALLLGEHYAANMGVDVRLVRRALLLITGLLTAVTTAFCGPISFIGLAVPHVARMVVDTADHRKLLPATVLIGSEVALVCQLVCSLPVWAGVLPINVVTPLVGAPVIIYVIIKRQQL